MNIKLQCVSCGLLRVGFAVFIRLMYFLSFHLILNGSPQARFKCIPIFLRSLPFTKRLEECIQNVYFL